MMITCLEVMVLYLAINPAMSNGNWTDGTHNVKSQNFRLFYSDVSSLESYIIAQKTVPTNLDCAHECLADNRCKGFNFKEPTERASDWLNCQLTNTLDHHFKASNKNGSDGWKFYRPAPRRTILNTNECQGMNTASVVVKDETQEGSADLFPGSTILSGEPHSNIDLLASWLPRQGTWRICWRVSRDGWNAEKFHGGCDDKGPTITIVKVNSYIFGGYTEASWKAPEIPGFEHKNASESFIFSLRNADNITAFQAQLIDRNDASAIVARNDNGPIFGFFSDLEISTKSTSTTQGFGRSYQAPEGYLYLKPETLSLLAGSQDFTPSEVEVYYVY